MLFRSNFFVFHSKDNPQAMKGKSISVDEFLMLTMASSASVYQYSLRNNFPLIVFTPLGDAFGIPATGGNDGITGAYTVKISLFSLGEILLPNLDVACINRSVVPGGAENCLETTNGIPTTQPVKLIGKDGFP